MERVICICASIATAIYTTYLVINMERRRIVRKVADIKYENLGKEEICYSVEITYDGGMIIFDLVSTLGNRYSTAKDLFTHCRELNWGWSGIMVKSKNPSDSVFLPWSAIHTIEVHARSNKGAEGKLTKKER